jgi:flap endonuclease-1
MGLDLKPIIRPSNITISELANKVVAVDAYNTIYQFLATIRGPTGESFIFLMANPILLS